MSGTAALFRETTLGTLPKMAKQEKQENSARRRILEGAKQAFLTFGYDGASMRTIADYTGYSQAGMAHHFASKADLLTETLEDSCNKVMQCFEQGADLDPVTRLYKIWRTMARIRTDVAMRSVIVSEASTLGHPGTELSIKALSDFQEAVKEVLPGMHQPHLMADAWEGLMVDWLYNPRADVPLFLKEAYFALVEVNDFPSAPGVKTAAPPEWKEKAPVAFGSLNEFGAGQAPEDPRRKQILDAAMQVFGDQGYVGGSLRNIAETLGVTHPALLRHYPSKDDLLRAILKRRDLVMTEQGVPATPREAVIHGLRQTRWSTEVPGLIRLFTALLTRSYQSTTPFHDFFAKRKAALTKINGLIFESLAEVGELRPDLDPKAQALLWACVWDGAQIRWGLDEGGTSVAGALAQYINQIVVPPLDKAEIESVGLTWPLSES